MDIPPIISPQPPPLPPVKKPFAFQDRLGIIERLGVQGSENHVTDFMTRHSKLLGLEP